ncbi:hypothetical protein QE152_g14445 [Popillia japonica]|uniref:Uncharacterized protein n=1 Tax=Popillia japonica TaxID=7064 RepID=A0AAW1L946_POPJA
MDVVASPNLRLGIPNPPAQRTVQTNPIEGQLPGASPTSSKTTESPVNGSVGATCTEYQCARTRPLTNFRKRKLLQTNGLHAVSKKAARPSTIRCGCVKPNVPCALCTGRTDPTHPRDPMEYLINLNGYLCWIPAFILCFHYLKIVLPAFI